jgi:hypothetical protein
MVACVFRFCTREDVVRYELQEWYICICGSIEDEGLGENLESTYIYSTALYFGEEFNETVLRDYSVPYRERFIL